uniref:PIR2-like helical domain-containing protein n=1 Tax=Setaria viridis TaxID=4556 RepID=A0A4U6W1G3_SETVI|nr:hypothetical protein SEVIR_2G428300v2 [Setaria viridis]
MMTTKFMDFDPEEHRRSMDRLLKESGGTKGYIGHVTLGPAIVEARPAAPPRTVKVPDPLCAPAGFDAGAGESWGIRPSPFEMQSYEAEALLEKIHRCHLDALAAMGKESVRMHARGMVFAGYAYGMLDDPVSNIVANALWYDLMFPPPSCENQVKMLSVKAIFRMAWRSRNALFVFMRHYAPFLGTQEILSCLLQADGNLQQAIRLLSVPDKGFGQQVGAFRAAIKAVDLPNEMVREAHLSFVASYGSARALLLSNRNLFSPSVLRCLNQNLPSDLHEHPIMHGLASTPTSSTRSLSSRGVCTIVLSLASLLSFLYV